MRNRYILLADLPLVAIAAAGAFALRFDWWFSHNRPEFVPFLASVLLFKPVVFYVFGLYGRYWQYASAYDLIAVTLAVSAASTGLAVGVALQYAFRAAPIEFSRQVLFIDWLLTLALVGGIRMSVRVMGEARRRSRKGGNEAPTRRALIVGAGEAGTLVAREMQKNPQLGVEAAGFLDDAPEKLGKRICGIHVIGALEALNAVVPERRIDEVIVAMPTAPGAVVRRIVDDCRRAGVKSRVVPGVYELLDGHVSISRLRNVEIADLLRRSQVAWKPEAASYVVGRVALITGAGGSIGSELSRQVAFARPSRLVLLGHGENSIFELQQQLAEQYPEVEIQAVIADIRDRSRIESVFTRHRPAVVFHAAAHKHVPLMEDNVEEAITNNVLGTFNLVRAAERHRVERFVLVSTDKAVQPTSVMGATKRLAEAIVRTAARDTGGVFVVVRFGNVLGSRGSVVPFFKKQIERGGPVTITDPDMRRFFMTIPEAVYLVLQAGGIGQGGELFVLNMGEPVRIVDLATDLIRLSGYAPEEIRIVFTGLRPGEKLEERLWEADATTEPTPHPDILRVLEREVMPAEELPGLVQALGAVCQEGNSLSAAALLNTAVPACRHALERAAADPGAPRVLPMS